MGSEGFDKTTYTIVHPGARIYLYGAGKLALLSAAIMQGFGWPLAGCIISDGQNKSRETVSGKPVYFLSEAVIDKDDLIILTSAAAYDREIMPALAGKGLVNIAPLTGWRQRIRVSANS